MGPYSHLVLVVLGHVMVVILETCLEHVLSHVTWQREPFFDVCAVGGEVGGPPRKAVDAPPIIPKLEYNSNLKKKKNLQNGDTLYGPVFIIASLFCLSCCVVFIA
jgi:hypothetical protein